MRKSIFGLAVAGSILACFASALPSDAINYGGSGNLYYDTTGLPLMPMSADPVVITPPLPDDPGPVVITPPLPDDPDPWVCPTCEQPLPVPPPSPAPTPVPWDAESGAIIGSITGIGVGLILRRLKNRKDINIKE
jgi:hypothetical protein